MKPKSQLKLHLQKREFKQNDWSMASKLLGEILIAFLGAIMFSTAYSLSLLQVGYTLTLIALFMSVVTIARSELFVSRLLRAKFG